MTPATILRLIAIALAGLLYVVPARASTTADALTVACPGHEHLAPMVETAARKHLLHPVLLVAVLHAESRCRMDRVGAAGERCAMQLRGVARNGRSNAELADPATCIDTGARWLSLRMVDCGGTVLGALAGYNGRTCRAGRRYAGKVSRVLAWIWTEVRRRREPVF